MKAFFAGICLFFATLVSCQQKGEGFTSVSADEFATLIADPEIQRLDVRTVAEYSEEHIPGSININVLDEQFAVVRIPHSGKTHRWLFIAVAENAARRLRLS